MKRTLGLLLLLAVAAPACTDAPPVDPAKALLAEGPLDRSFRGCKG